MKRPLIKLYIIIAAAFALTVILLPGIISKTSSAAVNAFTKADLIAYNAGRREAMALTDDKGAYAVIVMDDGWSSQYSEGYEILSRYGMKGCISVVPSLVGTQGFMSFNELADVYMDGWDLLNNTYDHTFLEALGKQEQEEQFVLARDWLNGHRFYNGSGIVVYPGGRFTEETKEVLEENGFTAGMSLNSVWDADEGCYREDIEIYCLISDTTFKQAKEAIDKAISSKTTCILMLHKIEPVTDDSQMQIEEELFEQIVSYLYENKDDISVVTMTRLLGS